MIVSRPRCPAGTVSEAGAPLTTDRTLDWTGLDWIGLDWPSQRSGVRTLDWIGLDWIGLDWPSQSSGVCAAPPAMSAPATWPGGPPGPPPAPPARPTTPALRGR
eukprot:1307130-Pyramimonas_sp.AAC.1